MFYYIIKNQKGGTVLLMTLMILMGILTVTLTVSEIVENGLKVGRSQADSTKAYFAAEAGAERMLWEIRKGPVGTPFNTLTCTDPGKFCFNSGVLINCPGGCDSGNIATTTLSNGANYYILYDLYNGPDGKSTTTLSCYGAYKEMRRKVDLKY